MTIVNVPLDQNIDRRIEYLTSLVAKGYDALMRAVEFITHLGPDPILEIPKDAAAQLPKAGKARVIVLTGDDSEDAEWQSAAYEQFMRDDAPEDAVYDNY